MSDEQNQHYTSATQVLLQAALCLALLGAVGGLVFELLAKNSPVPSAASESATEIVGKLEVTYMVITRKTATSEDAGGGTIEASRVQYFPNYVLVTRKDDVTILWAVDKLKKLEVKRMD